MFLREHEKPILKDIFDNTRNYLICGTLFAIGVWFRKGAVGVLKPVSEEPTSYYVGHFTGAIFIFIAAILTLLNVCQTFALAAPAYMNAMDGMKSWADKTPHKGRLKRIPRA